MKAKKIIAAAISAAMLLNVFPALTVSAEETKAVKVVNDNQQSEENREKLNFNQGWKFKREFIQEATSPEFSVEILEKWENVNLPHTVREEAYMNSGPGKTYQGEAMYIKHFPVSSSYEGKKLYIEFEGAMGVSDVWVNGTHMETKLASKTGKNTMYGGYLPFILDITDVVKYDGTDNVIAVRVDNSDNQDVPPGKPQNQLDFTYFGGIYRDAWLEVCEPVHITDANFEDIVAGGGILVDYPYVSEEEAEVFVKTHVRNESEENQEVAIKTEIIDKEGNAVAVETTGAETIQKGNDKSFEQTIVVENPKLWNLETPYMHTLVSTVLLNGEEIDKVETPIGIRKIEMHRDYGLKINGVIQEDLIGVNRHQEYAYLGYAGSTALQRRDAIKFKEGGINVVRTGHYPQSEDFLDACDELGILVLEPTPGWQHYRDNDTFKNRVYNDIRQMVRRDRNRPCILAYETVLNESGSAPGSFTQSMARVAKEEAPSVKTATENSLKGMSASAKDEVSDIMYKDANRSDMAVAFQREYGDSYREQYSPANFFYRRTARGTGSYYPGGEGAMFLQAVKRLMGNQEDTVYYCPVDGASSNKGGAKGSSRSYLSMAEWAERTPAENDPAFIGSTSWIGIDHNRGYANNMSPCGLWDLYRIPKFSYYAMASQRDAEENIYLKDMGLESGPMLFISSYWTEKAPVLDKSNESFKVLGTDEERIILVYSNAEKVKLSVKGSNGETLWSEERAPMTGKNREMLRHAPFEFLDVPYTSGSYLVGEGFDQDGNVIATQTVRTAGEAKKLQLEADFEGIDLTADGSDAVMLYASVVDENGTVCDTAVNQLKFTVVSGDAKIVGDGNARVGANPIKAEAGMIGAYLQAGMKAGEIIVRVESEGLEPAEITISSQEMEEKAAPYTEIEYTGTGEELSGYLASKEQMNSWPNAGLSLKKEKVTVGDNTYSNSLAVYNNMDLKYNLEGKYEKLTGGVFVKEDDLTKSAVFRVYVDGVLKYVSPKVTSGQMYSFNVNVSDGQELVLKVEDQNHDLETKSSCVWVAPYIYEGKGSLDESEIYQNLALNKPAEASSSVGETTPQMANDGTDTTIWRGEEVHEGENANPQEWIVDLEDQYNVRNAKIGLEHDSISYTYEIYTSSDKENWEKQITNTKSSQASDVLDEFTAQNVRYVKVRFTEVGEHADREQFSNATISEFEVYKDMGVESVAEYYLKGLTIENKDLVFDPAVKNYTLSLDGFENELRVRAIPMDEEATVEINGKKAVSSDEPIVIQELDENNSIVVEVSAKNGAKTQYHIQIEGKLGSIYESNPVKVHDMLKNGNDNWVYEEMNKSTGEIKPLTAAPYYVKNGEYCMQGSETYLRSGSKYMHPGNSWNAVRTYVAQKAGKVYVELWAAKYASQVGDVGISVLKNGERIWPKDAVHILKAAGTLNEAIVTDLEKGDRLQFVVDNAGTNVNDATCMNTTVRYIDDTKIVRAEIEGLNRIRIENGQEKTVQYTFNLETAEGYSINDAAVQWSLEEPVEGVTIDKNGLVTVQGDVEEGSFVLVAQNELNNNRPVTKQVRITKHECEESVEYVSDLQWESESTPTGWGTVGIDRILSHDGTDTTKVSLSDENGQRVWYDKGLAVNSYSELIYNVKDKGYSRFESYVGIDYVKRNVSEASVTFEVWKDNQKVYDSGDMNGKTAKKFISVDIEGAKTVKLVATLGKDGKNGNDNADWADAKFIRRTDVTKYAVSGKVEPGETGLKDLSGLKVDLYAQSDSEYANVLGTAVTDADGAYEIDTEVQNGNYIVRIEKILGKCMESVANIVVSGDDVIDGNITLVREIDKADLEALIEYAQGQKNSEDYTDVVPAVKKAFEAALDKAEAVMDNEKATQAEVDTAYDRLLQMVQMLDFTGNNTALKELVVHAEGLKEKLYTTESWAALNDALKKAQGVLKDENALQAEIDAAAEALKAAIDGLEIIPVDKTKLQKLVNKALEYDLTKYTETSKVILTGAIEEAQRVLEMDEVTQEEIDKAYAELQKAIFQLRLIPNKDQLEDLIKDAEAVDIANYTVKSATAFAAALDTAKAVFADEDATEEEVKAAEKELKEAKKNLVAKADADNNAGNKVASDNGSKKASDKSAAKTGDAGQTAVMMTMLMAAVAAVLSFRRKARR